MRVGQTAIANELAKNASDQIDTKAEKIRPIQSANVTDMIANRRVEVAIEDLASRGLYDWAEAEFKRAVALKTSTNIETRVRSLFAEYYWSAGEFQQAADILKPLVKAQPVDAEDNLPGRYNDDRELAAFYHFYLGLAAIKDGNKPLASELLIKSTELMANPDVVIAMKGIADEEPMRTYYREHFEKMAEDFRVAVASNEHALAESPDRMTRASVASNLASACNQLAWLLSKCETSPEEAINLSRRSLEFNPGEPAFLDTLGRCYFAAGKFEDAVLTQQKAVNAAPYDRLMRSQLAEFQAAFDARRAETQDKP